MPNELIQFALFSTSAFATACLAAYLILLRQSPAFSAWFFVFLGFFAVSISEFLKLFLSSNNLLVWILQRFGYLLIAGGFIIVYRAVYARETARLRRRKIASTIENSKSMIDPVTRLANRRQFETRTEIEFQRTVGRRKPLSVLALRVDDFKGKFSTYGQECADEILRSVAEIISSTIREAPRGEDLAARTSTDQFEILLVGADARVARNVADRLLEHIQLNPVNWKNQYVHLNASMGFHTYPWQSLGQSPQDLTSASAAQLILIAEDTLDRACRLGPGKILQGPLQGSTKPDTQEYEW